MTNQSGGGGASYPDVTGDGQTPGGLTVQGGMQGGGHDVGITPAYLIFYGSVILQDTIANAVDSDEVLTIAQLNPGTTHSARAAIRISRGGAVGASDYLGPTLQVDDSSDSAQSVFRATKNGVTQFQVDGDGVRVHGKFKTGASVAHVLGAYSGNAVPVYDEAGTLLGYMPLYA